jgi:hypothetical protein
MIQLLKYMVTMLMGIGNEPTTPIDPTIYSIKTMTRKYCGRILYQDNVVIKFKTGSRKAVKILKANIEQICPIESETTQQYFQWQKSQSSSRALAGG